MGILDRLSPSSQFIEVIEWLDDSTNTLVYRFPVKDQEIKNGAQLIVRESQAAVFVHEGQIADQFPPGRYTIDGGNTPILSKLGAWKHGFNSPFKSEVYFVNTKQFTDMKWGTPNPVMMRDTDFGMVRLRAFGIYSMRVAEPQAFIKEVAGTSGRFITEDVEGQLKRTLVGGFSDALGESKIAALDLASNYDELGKFTRTKLNEEFKTFGLELTKFVIENISLPQEVEAAMDKRTSMGVIGDVGRYAQFQAADAMRDAAQNPSGGASTGAGLGAGFAIAAGYCSRRYRAREVLFSMSVCSTVRVPASTAKLSVDDDLSFLREFEHITLARILIARSPNDATRLLERLRTAALTSGKLADERLWKAMAAFFEEIFGGV